MSLRIGFDAKRAFQNRTGLGNYSRMIITGMAQQHPDIELVLFTPKRKGPHAHFVDDYPQVRVVEPRGLWRLCPSLWRTLAMGRKARREGVSLFHGLSHELPLLLPRSVKAIVTMHDLIAWRYPHQFHWADRMIYHAKFCHACRRADTVIAVSRQTAADVESMLHVDANKVKVVYQSCDEMFYRPVTSEQREAVRKRYDLPEQYLVAVGTIEERKNQETLVRAMALLPDALHLVIVGRRTKYYERVADAIKSLGLQQRVHCLEGVRFEDFPALYAEAELSLYVSFFEGFGIPVLESLCCGTPVVAAQRSSLPEVGGQAAVYADPSSPQSIASQVDRILSDADSYQQLVAAAPMQAQRFSRAAIIDDLMKVYKALL